MIRWIDGFYGGLAAGTVSAGFYALAAAAWLHDDSAAVTFTHFAHALPRLGAAPVGWPAAGAGAVLYLLIAGALGIVYALIARNVPSAWRAPTSVLWGVAYGTFVWWLMSDVAVPVFGVVDMRPLWEGVTATVVFYGVVLSEVTTMARRRAAGAP